MPASSEICRANSNGIDITDFTGVLQPSHAYGLFLAGLSLLAYSHCSAALGAWAEQLRWLSTCLVNCGLLLLFSKDPAMGLRALVVPAAVEFLLVLGGFIRKVREEKTKVEAKTKVVYQVVAKNRYEDVADRQVYFVFAGQVALMMCILSSLRESADDFGNCDVVFWCVAVIIQFIAQNQVGETFQSERDFWCALAMCACTRERGVLLVDGSLPGDAMRGTASGSARRIKFREGLSRSFIQAADEAGPATTLELGGWAWTVALAVRFLMSGIVNLCLRNTLLYILPIVLMRETDQLSFVKDAVAILFVGALDDLPSNKTFTLHFPGSGEDAWEEQGPGGGEDERDVQLTSWSALP